MLRDFVEKVCTGYSGLVHTPTKKYRKVLNVAVADEQLRGEYVGGYRIGIGEHGYSLYIADENSHKE